jgi:YD repeat-containing protein
VETIRYPLVSGLSRVSIRIEFDDFDHLVSVQDPSAGGTAYWTLQDTDNNGLLLEESFGNGVSGSRLHDEFGRLRIALTTSGTNSSVTCDRDHPHQLAFDGTFDYDYDGAGNRVQRSNDAGELRKFSYTPFGKPRSIWDETRAAPGRRTNQVTLRYDADMQRAVKDIDETITTYIAGVYERRVPKRDGGAEHVFYIAAGNPVVAQLIKRPGQPLAIE